MDGLFRLSPYLIFYIYWACRNSGHRWYICCELCVDVSFFLDANVLMFLE